MKTVLVTGATSYIGTQLVSRLLHDGLHVHTIVRPTSDLERLSALSPEPTIHIHDASAASLRDIMERVRPETVYHLAAVYRREHTTDSLDDMLRGNISFGVQLLEAMAQAGIRELINTGSYFEHGADGSYQPLCLYAAMKESFRVLTDCYRDKSALKVIHLKLFDVYGPGDPRRKLIHALGDAQRSGSVLPMLAEDIKMNLVYIDDVVDAYVRAGIILRNAEKGSSQSYAVRHEHDRTLREVVRMYERVSREPVPVKWGALPARERECLEPWKGPTLPGWTARVDLEEGLSLLLRKPEMREA